MRSGKSSFAERQASESGCAVTVIATAQALDSEMAGRIAHHRARRPTHWRTVEAPIELAAALRAEACDNRFVIVDCVTLWATNHLCPAQGSAIRSADWPTTRDEMLDLLPQLAGHVALIANEIGWGVVPLGEQTRRFIDEAGRLNQAMAARSDSVTLVVAGLPLRLKANA